MEYALGKRLKDKFNYAAHNEGFFWRKLLIKVVFLSYPNILRVDNWRQHKQGEKESPYPGFKSFFGVVQNGRYTMEAYCCCDYVDGNEKIALSICLCVLHSYENISYKVLVSKQQGHHNSHRKPNAHHLKPFHNLGGEGKHHSLHEHHDFLRHVGRGFGQFSSGPSVDSVLDAIAPLDGQDENYLQYLQSG